MTWLRSLFGGESVGLTLVLIVVGLAVALVLLFWLFRKIAGDNALKPGRNRQPRLSVTDAAIVDDKRRLVLVRRDNVEHLVMIGGPTDIVIEQNISRAPIQHGTRPGIAAETAEEPAPAGEHAAEAPRAARPRLFGGRDTERPPEAAERPRVVAAEPSRREAPPPEIPRQAPALRAVPPVAEAADYDFEGDLARSLELATGDRPQARPEPRQEPAPEPRHEPRHEPRQEARPEPRPEPRPEARQEPEVRPPAEGTAGPRGPEPEQYGSYEAEPRRTAAPPVQTVVEPPARQPSRDRPDSMEDEMQRLLDELASSKPN